MTEVTQTVQLAARVPEDLVAALTEIAEADDRTLSYVVRQALKSFVENHSQEEAA